MRKPAILAPWLMLISRSILFLAFQALIALFFVLRRNPFAWDASAGWWLLTVIPANLISIYWLFRRLQAEGSRFLDLFRFSRDTVKKDLLWFFGSSVIGLPLVALPIGNWAKVLFADPLTPIQMMFRPMPGWALGIGFLFPLTIAFAELPTYFGYVMPRLAKQLNSPWLAWLICSLVLAAQHIFLPFIPDGRFILWRLGMYLPFALFAGMLLKLRPQLLPYMAIMHGLLDISTLSVYWMI